MIEHIYKNTLVFKFYGNKRFGLIADELEDRFPEYKVH